MSMFGIIKPYLNIRYFLYLFSLVASWPCVFYLLGFLPDYKINYLFLFTLAFIFAALKKALQIPIIFQYLIGGQILGWIFYATYFEDTSYFTRIFCLVITFFFLGIQVKYKHLEFIKTFNSWLVFQSIAGGIGFLLVTFNVLNPIFQFTEMDGRPGVFYGLFTTNVFGGGLCRNAGFYDEPGALACWGMYALLFNKLFVDNRKVELLLIFGLISTLSMAYFIQIPIYLFSFYKGQRSKLVLPILFFFLILYGLSKVNSYYEKAIFGRFEYNEQTGTLAGDNRADQIENAYKIFKDSPVIGVGAENLIDLTKTIGFVGANIFGSLASDGFVGIVLVYSPLFLLFFYGRKKPKYFYAAIILLLGFYQRPYGATFLICPLVNFSLVMYAYFDIHNPEELRQANGKLYISDL